MSMYFAWLSSRKSVKMICLRWIFWSCILSPVTYIFLFVAGILNRINKRCVYLLWVVSFVVWKVSWCSHSLHRCLTSLVADQKGFQTEYIVITGGTENWRHGKVANCRHLIYVNLKIKLRCRLCVGEIFFQDGSRGSSVGLWRQVDASQATPWLEAGLPGHELIRRCQYKGYVQWLSSQFRGLGLGSSPTPARQHK